MSNVENTTAHLSPLILPAEVGLTSTVASKTDSTPRLLDTTNRHVSPPISASTLSAFIIDDALHVDSQGPRHAQRPNKRVSPGLIERLRRFDAYRRRRAEEEARRKSAVIGRIPEEQLAHLELRVKERTVEVQRKGRAWRGPPIRVDMPSSPDVASSLEASSTHGLGGVRLNGGPVLNAQSESETSQLESDISSIISISERLAASDAEDAAEDGLVDSEKYRLPDIGKTRLHLRTKEPLSPMPRQVLSITSRRPSTPTPTTPKSMTKDSDEGYGHAIIYTNGMGHSPSRASVAESVYPAGASAGAHNGSTDNVSESDFISSGISRAGSIYTLSRVSFTGQLAQLTSMKLPDAESMSKRISSIPTSKEAAKELSDASEQIRMWVSQASKVLGGLNAEDDVEWAAAGGRDGMEDVDKAISRFDRLVQVYVTSIERLQTRDDIKQLSAPELLTVVTQMESIIGSWDHVKQTLSGVKEQVEIAMEWEELWNTVLGEIGQEMEGLNRLVFEMEEKRHSGAEGLLSSKDSLDISELETIIEERPGKRAILYKRSSSTASLAPSSPLQATPSTQLENKDEPSLLALFARMQPLRASLDFLPMRLSAFHLRAAPIFPTACEDLEHRQSQLEDQWKKVEADAESLRRELGEDKWILVFRNAGRQALKMCESVSRSYNKLKDAADSEEHQTDPVAFTKKVESYDAKKTHYGPALERVLAIIDRGVLDRLTVNGEILRLQSDMKKMWINLQDEMRDLDSRLEDIGNQSRDKQLRDSVSTVMSSERSVASSMLDGTPGSSPASSVVGTSRKNSLQGGRTPTTLTHTNTRRSSTIAPQKVAGKLPAGRVASCSGIPKRTPLTQTQLTQRPLTHRASYGSLGYGAASPSPVPTRISMKPETPVINKPKFRTGKPEYKDFLPLSALEPSPYAKAPITPKKNYLRASSRTTPVTAPARSSRAVSTPASSMPRPASSLRKSMLAKGERKSSLPVPTISTPKRASSTTPSPLAHKSSSSALVRPSSRLASNGRKSSMLPERSSPLVADGNEADSESPSHYKKRSLSSLGRPPSLLVTPSGRRSSMLPRASSRLDKVGEGAAPK